MNLSDKHLVMLRSGSGLSDEVITARGYRTVTDSNELSALGFRRHNAASPVFCYHFTPLTAVTVCMFTALTIRVFISINQSAKWTAVTPTSRSNMSNRKILVYGLIARRCANRNWPILVCRCGLQKAKRRLTHCLVVACVLWRCWVCGTSKARTNSARLHFSQIGTISR